MAGPGRKPTISDEEILAIIQEIEDPVATTREIADAIELSRRGTYQRLEQLADDGLLRKKKVGETGAVWWLPEARKNQ